MASNHEIYNLITSLCEKFTRDPEVVKKLRSKSYEILLKKQIADSPKEFQDLDDADTLTNIRAWQFILATQYGLEEHAHRMVEIAEEIDDDCGSDILKFLMCFRQIPQNTDNIEDCCSADSLPDYVKNLLGIKKTNKRLSNESTVKTNSNYLWELAVKEKYSKRRTWESYGYAEPDKEHPFLTELSGSLWLKSLPSLYFIDHFQSKIHLEIKSSKSFTKDLKYLLVGLVSYSFSTNDSNQFYLIPNITVEGIAPNSLKKFCEIFIICGNCYKELQRLSVPNLYTGEYQQEGYIFKELCEGIHRYLEFYRYAIMKLPDNIGIFNLDNRTKELRNQIMTLTKICKLGPYRESSEILHGVSLLNHLYQTILNEFDKKLLLVLCAIVYPCFQVYFSRFIQPWLLEGSINDPYNEFFIQPITKYIQTRGRTYWTRSFTVRNDIVPDFLVDLQQYILQCGKAINLLKLCNKNSKFCQFLMGEKPPIFSSCFTAEQLLIVQRNTTRYYLEMSLLCPRLNLEDLMRKETQEDPIFMEMIAKQRLATLRRIELERQKILEENRLKKMEEMNSLRQQYLISLRQKEQRLRNEVEKEMKDIEFNLEMEQLKDQLIQREANNMIEYYDNLCQIADNRRKVIEKQIDILKNNNFDRLISTTEQKITTTISTTTATSSDESFYSVANLSDDHLSTASSSSTVTLLKSPKSLDIINANSTEETTQTKTNILETFQLAQKIKEKVLKEEMDINVNYQKPTIKIDHPLTTTTTNLTEAQRNKLKVLSSEFDMLGTNMVFQTKHISFEAENNRNVMMKSNINYDNYNLNSTKIEEKISVKSVEDDNDVKERGPEKLKPPTKLHLMIEDKAGGGDTCTPMSIDSTPMSDSVINFEKIEVTNTPLTITSSKMTDDGSSVNFDRQESQDELLSSSDIYFSSNHTLHKTVFSKRVRSDEISETNYHLLKVFLHESILLPLTTQMNLANNELIKYFMNDLNCLKHLKNLRNYFFLQDGEFGRNMTENLFEKLYDVHSPEELINCRTLHNLVTSALRNSSKYQDNTNCLSFRINSMPKRFLLRDPDVLDCLSLSYKIDWPLNILLPIDTINKYDEVFKYLLKLNRVSWILKKIFLELKILAKETGKKEIYLMSSPHYRRIHQCRHVMLHFIQTFQNYIVGEVLQPSWEIFGRNLAEVTNLDQLYSAHTTYVKSILLLCHLNQKSAVIRKIIQNIFVVILKFYDYLRSRSWKCEDGFYVHPNFSKLETLFQNFEEFVFYLFKIGRKIVKTGCQSQFVQLLDMLDINDYYSQRMNIE